MVTTKAPEFVTRQQHNDHLESERRRIGALETRMDRVEDKMESDKQELLDAMNDVRKEVSDAAAKIAGLDERTEATNTALNVQDRKLDAILSKL